ncbi:sulfatase-like hydrolase/transferase [Seonamhaeicola algicola]|uniref:Sulfatase-like hydrolase/transferase n=1 Tax=Seonamhaeicola algicola TaxID=1719036 RepID=A0A5C7ACC6_9FLAO|nr:sulfatase-like hydrolase/transferase [Seonamhaeicola algicola]TXE06306.1 sulfatase-like hydrolase/transferase [Seonamhaeicola algicola]
MKKITTFLLFFSLLFIAKPNAFAQEKPNVLWIVTDDHRYDAVRAFNKMLTGNEMSELGYVESPNIDRLTEMGTTFINTYCQASGCAPSRASMHSGRYPFRSGVYEFEYHHNKAEHSKPTFPEQLASLGYQTLRIGKLGVRLKTVENGKSKNYNIYQNNFDFKQLRKDGFTGWGKDWFYEMDGKKLDKPFKSMEYFVTPKGEFEYISERLENEFPKYKGTAQKAHEKYDLLRHYNEKKGPQTPFSPGILAGVSSRKAGETRDGYYVKIFDEYLKNEEETFSFGSQTVNGINENKPQFFYIGFDFPHTPVLPPASYRERFKKHTYKIPEFNEKELKTMPKQFLKQVKSSYTNHFTDEEKQKMIQDYFAFCAYGDNLIGKAVDDFIAYNKKKNKPYLIVYVNGDHGWKLNDHGAVSKFTPWNIDSHNPIVVISSDENKFPAGKVVEEFTEFVDIAPTILSAAGANIKTETFKYLDGMDLAKVAANKAPKRDYVIGEAHAVTGPRAFIRTKDFMFSIQTRPNKTRGENMEWALNASYEDLDPALYDTKNDPHEVNNLAFNKKYEKIAEKMKEKLINIVLGDNRVEVGWGKGSRVTGKEIYRSNFAPGAHDYKLKL